MSQKLTFYPEGNAETCLLELSDKKLLLFDYANMNDGTLLDKRLNLANELSEIDEFSVVMFSHAHEDHTKGSSDFFYLDHAEKYQSEDRAKIKELWVSAAFIMEADLDNQSDAKVIRAEARYRLRNGYGIKVFAKSDFLLEWLNSQGIAYSQVEKFILHAGDKINIDDNNEIEFFVHAPFCDDSEDVQDKNDPSIVMQIRLFNLSRETNILITGDTPYTVLDKIIEKTKKNNNEERLLWDIYDIPHHCSYTGLNEKTDSDTEIIPTESIKWLLEQGNRNAKMIASCDKVTKETGPPHLIAKKAYERYTSSDVCLYITMDCDFEDGIPLPIVFEIDEFGITKTSNNLQKDYFKKAAPRAGE